MSILHLGVADGSESWHKFRLVSSAPGRTGGFACQRGEAAHRLARRTRLPCGQRVFADRFRSPGSSCRGGVADQAGRQPGWRAVQSGERRRGSAALTGGTACPTWSASHYPKCRNSSGRLSACPTRQILGQPEMDYHAIVIGAGFGAYVRFLFWVRQRTPARRSTIPSPAARRSTKIHASPMRP